jgi:hypothetical protein
MTQPIEVDDAVVEKPRKKKRSKTKGPKKTGRVTGVSRFPRNAIAVAIALVVGVGIGRALGVRS